MYRRAVVPLAKITSTFWVMVSSFGLPPQQEVQDLLKSSRESLRYLSACGPFVLMACTQRICRTIAGAQMITTKR